MPPSCSTDSPRGSTEDRPKSHSSCLRRDRTARAVNGNRRCARFDGHVQDVIALHISGSRPGEPYPATQAGRVGGGRHPQHVLCPLPR